MPSERMELAHVGELAHSAVGLCSIPSDFAVVSNGTLHQFGKLADCNLLAAANVDVAVADFATGSLGG